MFFSADEFSQPYTVFDLQRRGEHEYLLALIILCSCEDLHLVPSYYPTWN
jgi:hypothetical protein